jgi:hypothetical protein
MAEILASALTGIKICRASGSFLTLMQTGDFGSTLEL